MRTLLLLVSSLLLASAGCSSVRDQETLLQKVAFDRGDCPVERLRLVRISPDRRTVEVDACGALRRYQDIHSGNKSSAPAVWLDVTPCSALATPGHAASPPGGP